jgi:hypothetical protein
VKSLARRSDRSIHRWPVMMLADKSLDRSALYPRGNPTTQS